MNGRRGLCGALFMTGLIGLAAGCDLPLPGPGTGGGGTNGSGGGRTVPAEFDAASAKVGGALYDKYWDVTGGAEPSDTHALWATRPDKDSNTRVGADTWRCKECHGWDYKGVDGVYASGSHRTGIQGIFGTTLSPQEAFDLIKTDHGYGTVLADGDIWNLAKFVLEGQIDADDIIDANGAFVGGPTAADPTAFPGQRAYDTICSGCHGFDGRSIPPGGDDDFDEWVGELSNENPWEFQHKVRFGQPGTAMPAQFGSLTLEEIGELAAYAQSLPAQ